jgi:AraC-like DNA-binding protein
MKSHFKSYDLIRLLKSVAKRFEKEIQHDCQKHWITLGADAGKGQICAYDFEDGVQMFVLNGILPDDWEIITKSADESPFLLYFNVRGSVSFEYEGLKESIDMVPLKTIMTSHLPNQSQRIFIKKDESVTFVCINLERRLYINHIGCLPDSVKLEVASICNGKTALKEFQNSAFGLKGAALVQQVIDDKKEGLIHATFAESKAIELFSIQLRRWEEEIVKSPAKSKMLRTDDVEKIIMARNLLVADLKNAPTIEVLSKKSGVNRQQLKQAFKKMFGTTINDYLRNERLRMAKHLLSAGEPSIKDVAATVGYENSSYFARRYKEKYGLYPNEYMRSAQAMSEEE